jgi:eukaryotic-like serine/threonine-protein kinase
MPDKLTPDEASTLDRLDAYLAELHAGRRPDRGRWVADHPHLAPFLDALDRLDALAPDPDATVSESAPPADAAPPPDLVADGKYELLGELGRGGMGVVYKARQSGLDRVVALKMILAGALASAEQHRRFEAEARVAARVQHPHVVAVYEAGRVNGLPYLVMQYVDGCSLAQRLKRGPLAADEAARLVAAVARAVDALHAAGIVHRDLKPSNILIDSYGRPFVTDFGLAKLVEGESGVTQTGAVLGTPQYMAPEQAAGGSKSVGPTADVYSLGAILYECLTGRPVVAADSPLDALVAVLEGEPAPPRRVNPQVPRPLEQVCLQCLDKAPERRYASAAALADALDCYLRGDPVPIRRAGVIERLRRWGRREPALASRLAALAAFSGVVVGNHIARDDPSVRSLTIPMLLLLAAWAAVSWVCQRGLRVPRLAHWSTYAWSVADVSLLTAAQVITEAGVSPLIIGYPVLIAAAGLWTKQWMVWVTTACTIAGYVGLILVNVARTGEEPRDLHRHVIFVICLAVLGFVTCYQVQRVRALSRYYEGRRDDGTTG